MVVEKNTKVEENKAEEATPTTEVYEKPSVPTRFGAWCGRRVDSVKKHKAAAIGIATGVVGAGVVGLLAVTGRLGLPGKGEDGGTDEAPFEE